MSGQEGIINSTMLLRRNPFGEWVVVYYEPDKISEKEIHRLIVNEGCPNASIIRRRDESVTMNPIVAGGDVVQLRVDLEKASSLTIEEIPKNWKIESGLKDLGAGKHFLTVRVPRGAARKATQISLKDTEGTIYEFPVVVVGRVPG